MAPPINQRTMKMFSILAKEQKSEECNCTLNSQINTNNADNDAANWMLLDIPEVTSNLVEFNFENNDTFQTPLIETFDGGSSGNYTVEELMKESSQNADEITTNSIIYGCEEVTDGSFNNANISEIIVYRNEEPEKQTEVDQMKDDEEEVNKLENFEEVNNDSDYEPNISEIDDQSKAEEEQNLIENSNEMPEKQTKVDQKESGRMKEGKESAMIDDTNKKKKRTKRHLVNESDWKKNINKSKREKGEEYLGKKK